MVANFGPSSLVSYEDGAKTTKSTVQLMYDPSNPKACRAWLVKAISLLASKPGVYEAITTPPPSASRFMRTHGFTSKRAFRASAFYADYLRQEQTDADACRDASSI